MSPEKQRIIIAETLGVIAIIRPIEEAIKCMKSSDEIGDFTVPDYLNDLNAIHKAEMTLPLNCNHPQCHDKFASILEDIVGDSYQSVSATAKQRAEAFLKIMKLWEE